MCGWGVEFEGRGGGTIDFVREAIDKPIPIDQLMLPVKVTIPEARPGISMFGATRGRLAVSLGGASEDYDALVHEQPAVATIRRGSL